MDKSHNDRLLFSLYLNITSPGFKDYQASNQMIRNGRWGTCVDCPFDAAFAKHPELCENTDRYDHNLHTTKDGKFFEYSTEISLTNILDVICKHYSEKS